MGILEGFSLVQDIQIERLRDSAAVVMHVELVAVGGADFEIVTQRASVGEVVMAARARLRDLQHQWPTGRGRVILQGSDVIGAAASDGEDLGRRQPTHLFLVRPVDQSPADAAVPHEIGTITILAIDRAVVVGVGG